MSVYRLKGSSGLVANQTFHLVEKLVIGRADDCDIRVDDNNVQAHQAEVILSPEGHVVVADLSNSGGVKINGEVISREQLVSGDEIRVGNCRLMLQAPGLRPKRVLDGEAIQPNRRHWPWLLIIALGGLAFLAYKNGWLTLLSGFLTGRISGIPIGF